jgi:hypothetical protein
VHQRSIKSMEERREGGREGGEGVIFSIIPIIDNTIY